MTARCADPATLLIAPTGGGKTMAGFLPTLSELAETEHDGLHTLYVSPLKALAADIKRNLRKPVEEMGLPIRIEDRTGDTSQTRKKRQRADPPHILLTTPESLALLLSYEDAPAMFAGLFLDEVAEKVEQHSYPQDAPGKPLSTAVAVLTGVQFGLMVLLVNIMVLPMLFFGIGALIMVVANSYLLSREYFGMVATRHLPVREASALRKANKGRVWAAGLVPAGLALVPILNLLVPIFSTAYFVHIFKTIKAEAA